MALVFIEQLNILNGLMYTLKLLSRYQRTILKYVSEKM